MGKGRDKIVKTYGRHKNRVIKTDFWDSEVNRSVQNIFSVSDSVFDDSDFIDPKLTKSSNNRKRKNNKDEDKENKTKKPGKTKQGQKKKEDHKLFSEKENSSSFSDCTEGRPLKDLPPKVPASVRKNRAGNRTKLRFEESQLLIESKEKSLSINFSDFDSYNLCISDSPVQTTTKPECPTSADSGKLGKILSPGVFSKCPHPSSSESYENSEPSSQKDAVKRKPKKTGITTSTPMATITAVSRLQKPINRIPEERPLFEDSHTHPDCFEDSRSSLSNLKDNDGSVRYSTPKKMNSPRPYKDNLSSTRNSSPLSVEQSLQDCFVPLKKIDQGNDNSLNISDHLMSYRQKTKDSLSPMNGSPGSVEQSLHDCFVKLKNLDQETENDCLGRFVSMRTKERKSNFRRQLRSENNNYIIYKNNDFDEDATENKESKDCLESPMRTSICADCSFGNPCGDGCAYFDNKLSPDNCSVELQKLQDFFHNLTQPLSLENSVNLDASQNLFESYLQSSRMLHDTQDSSFEDNDIQRVSEIIEEESDIERLNQVMGSTVLSNVEMEEGELVSSCSEGEQTDEDESGDVQQHVESCGPGEFEIVEQGKKVIEEGELVDSSAGDDEIDEEDESGDEDVENCGPAENGIVDRRKEKTVVKLSFPTRSPYLTRNYTSSICTDSDSICTNVTQNSMCYGSLVRSPYMTRNSKLVLFSPDQSKVESMPSTPSHDGSASRSYKETVENNNNISHISNMTDLSTSSRSFIEALSPKKSALSPRSKVLHQCEQDDFISFQDCINPSMMKNCVKIGEGVYGEVFRTKKKGQSVALKIIPLEGDFEVNECPQKDFVEMLPEIVISRELSELRNGIEDQTQNFVLVNSVSCLKGAWPAQLMKEWDIFHKQKRSENDRPDIFGPDQLFILFEFGDGGSALEHFKLTNLRQTKSVLQQVAYGLAIAESAFEFEHRDLHWGNVLVRPCASEKLQYKLNGSDIYLPSWGLEVSIIDFTLSRLRKDDCTVFCDLAKDEVLFEGTGDYQFDVYRLMQQETENQWERYRPKTNVYWIHYLADKLLKCKKYEKNTREDNEILRSLRQFVREVTDYSSCIDLVTTCPFMMASV